MIEQLIKAVQGMEVALLAEMQRVYQKGTILTVRLRHGVKTTQAEVLYCIGGRDAELRVKLETGYVTTIQHRKVIAKP